METFNECVLCNPEENWLELDFRSELDIPIDSLEVTITLKNNQDKRTKTTSNGYVFFDKIAAGEWTVTTTTQSLLSEVEKYQSRKEQSSPVKSRTSQETGKKKGSPITYKKVTIGDFWDKAPEDEFLTEHHKGNFNDEKELGFKTSHNKSLSFEFKSLRSFAPIYYHTPKFNIVNAYTFSLLSKLSYAEEEQENEVSSNHAGSIRQVLEKMKLKEKPLKSSDLNANWLLKEVPYSSSYNYKLFEDEDTGSFAFIIYNKSDVIISVRGTEPYFTNGKPILIKNKSPIYFNTAGIGLLTYNQIIRKLTNSSGFKDLVITDFDAKQVKSKQLRGTYLHEGFIEYSLTLWNFLKNELNFHKDKKFILCGHSLGGASATILSALINDNISKNILYIYI